MALPLVAATWLLRRYGMKKLKDVAKDGVVSRVKRGGMNAVLDTGLGLSVAEIYDFAKKNTERQTLAKLKAEKPKLYKQFMASDVDSVKEWLHEHD